MNLFNILKEGDIQFDLCKYPLKISVDGGVNLETSKKLSQADVLISASAILSADNPNYVIKELKKR